MISFLHGWRNDKQLSDLPHDIMPKETLLVKFSSADGKVKHLVELSNPFSGRSSFCLSADTGDVCPLGFCVLFISLFTSSVKEIGHPS